ncbi:hypothetical protein HMPREF9136_1028 [Prevotella dentalis DSM 3688]|uniref:Uncharacterized protein n=1 Tax=Prevotella dentalis (strain ATCC 49559 / DSM 3688 / JCM 13448 / NCTC 12043 / ES 2772) TaxID=908937 RepID=F9D2K0_PREDD|nr:hypothetical protein HMPREF9136_1028 [Prevotella dentalis DSM 3688]
MVVGARCRHGMPTVCGHFVLHVTFVPNVRAGTEAGPYANTLDRFRPIRLPQIQI